MPETTDRRAMLAEAFNRATETEEEPVETTEAPAEEPAAEPEQPAEVEAESDETEEPTEQPAESEKPRDEKGRFQPQAAKAEAKPAKAPKVAAPKPAAPQPPAKPVAAPAPEKPAAAPAPADRPPQSWTAQAREVWKDVPPAARQEIHRLEGETRRVLQRNAELTRTATEAGKFKEQVEGNLRTWEPIFRAEGTDSLTGAMNVVQTYGALHFAPPQQKAAILLGLIERFSTFDDINAIAEARAQGRMPQMAPQQARPVAPQPQQDPRAIFREELQTFQQQAAVARAQKDYDAFLATSPEFIDSPGVQENMQAILDASAKRGRNLTYSAAYDLALKMDEGIQSVLAQRAQAAAITQSSATAPTARARVATATIRSKPGPTSGPAADPNDRRAMLQRRWDGQ